MHPLARRSGEKIRAQKPLNILYNAGLRLGTSFVSLSTHYLLFIGYIHSIMC